MFSPVMETGLRLMSPAMLSMERGRVQYLPAVSRLHTSNNTQQLQLPHCYMQKNLHAMIFAAKTTNIVFKIIFYN